MSVLTKNTTEFLKVLGDQTRLEILNLLKKGALSSKDIQTALKKKQPTISQQLKILQDSDLIIYNIKENDNGKKTKYYSYKDKQIYEILSSINYFIAKKNNKRIKDLSNLDVLDTLL